jgi:hypothetical protein
MDGSFFDIENIAFLVFLLILALLGIAFLQPERRRDCC